MKNQFLKTRLLGFVAFSSLILGSMVGCAEVAGSGAFVSIPSVSFQCAGSGCAVAGSRFVHVSYTTSSCSAAEFGETVTGSTTVTCNGAQCAGLISSFVDTQGSATSMREGVYNVCVTVDVDNNWSTGPAAGDMIGSVTNVRVVSGTATQSVTSFSLKP